MILRLDRFFLVGIFSTLFLSACLEVTDSGLVTVRSPEPPKGVTPASARIKPGGHQHLQFWYKDICWHVNAKPADEWSSSDPEVATVDWTGLVTALKEGSVVITARYAKDRIEVPVEVTPLAQQPVEVLSVYPADGDAHPLGAEYRPATPSNIICQGDLSPFTAVGVAFDNPGGEGIKSTTLTVTDAEGASVQKSWDGSYWLGDFSPGDYHATVERVLNSGRVITYGWSFTVLGN